MSRRRHSPLDSRARFFGAVFGMVVLLSCSMVMPNTAQAVAPQGATVEEAGLGLLADIQMWFEIVGGWAAFLFGV